VNAWPLILFLLLISLALLYPLRQSPKLALALFPCLLVLIGLGYSNWGGFSAWSDYQNQQKALQQAQKVLGSIKSPQEVIARLRAQLQAKPDSAQGWYLLGRLYSQEKQLIKAQGAFAKAYQLEPENSALVVQYAYSIWDDAGLRPQARLLLQKLLQKHPKQEDALALLAQDAFSHQEYNEAVGYWRRLRAGLAPGSKEALAVERAIALAVGHISA
jgi:cytochrome c-type biogenesis protein CcmH